MELREAINDDALPSVEDWLGDWLPDTGRGSALEAHERDSLRVLLAKERADAIRAFARAILHGDGEHQLWLLQSAEEFAVTGKALPPRPHEEQKP